MELEYYNFDGDDLDFGKYYLMKGKIQELIEYIFKKDNDEIDYDDIPENRILINYVDLKKIIIHLPLFMEL